MVPAYARRFMNGLKAERFDSVVTTSDLGFWLSLNPIRRVTSVVVL